MVDIRRCVSKISIAQVATYAGEIEDAKEEVRKNPDDAKAHNNLGNVYVKSVMYKEAIESYKQALRIDPDHADAHFGLGVCYIGIRDKSSALRQHKILKKLDTKLAKRLLGMILTELD